MIVSAHPTLRFADLWRRRSPAARALLRAPGLYKTYNARAALYQVFRTIRKQRGGIVLVPAFHCPTVIDPVLEAGLDVAFYGVRSDLTIDEADLWARAQGDVAAVIAIHYLGFPTDLSAPLALRRERGCLVVEDYAHSFLRAAPVTLAADGGDAAVYSFYKLVPTYAGGAFQIRSSAVSWSGALRPVSVGHTTVIAKRLLEEVIGNSGSGVLRAVFDCVEGVRVRWKRRRETHSVSGTTGTEGPAEHDPYRFDMKFAARAMPWLSRAILGGSDLAAIVGARRRNYAAWSTGLIETPRLQKLWPILPTEVCPWAYPVVLDNRGTHDHVLRQRGVPLFTFGERLHPLFRERAAGIFPQAEMLSRNLVLFAVHQNLDIERIEQACTAVNAHFRDLG